MGAVMGGQWIWFHSFSPRLTFTILLGSVGLTIGFIFGSFSILK
jgi:hypothetical protein